jgi:hypothetical protein
MKRYSFFIVIALLGFVTACKQEAKVDEKKVEQILGDGKDYQDLIRNPVSANGLEDTVNIAKVSLEEKVYDFGTVKEGVKIKHDFKLTNTGKVPLLIQDATSTCGCTVPEVNKEPIEPGHSDVIHVIFDTKGKAGYQEKPVTIFTNAYPSKHIVVLKGTVEK